MAGGGTDPIGSLLWDFGAFFLTEESFQLGHGKALIPEKKKRKSFSSVFFCITGVATNAESSLLQLAVQTFGCFLRFRRPD